MPETPQHRTVTAEVELSAGTIEYEDTGGAGPVVVLVHGVVMDGSLWRHVVRDLRDGHRCVVPTLPLGAHRIPMRPDADLSMRGVALLVAEFMEKLDLHDVTLVINDLGAPQLLVPEGRDQRIGRLVLTSCEAFGNSPPGPPGRNLDLLARLPRGIGLGLAARLMKVKPAQRLPMTFGWMTKRPIPQDVLAEWCRPLQTTPGVRRDLRAFLRSVPPKSEMVRWSEGLRAFDRPALVAWAAEDRLMPPEHGRRLAELLPHGTHVEIPDSYTLIPEDQPARLAAHLRRFIAGETPGETAGETPGEVT